MVRSHDGRHCIGSSSSLHRAWRLAPGIFLGWRRVKRSLGPTTCLLCSLCTNYSTTLGGPKVYDVTKYLDDHPGGAEVMLDVAGQDADEFFEDIGHSNDARKELKKHYIGDYKIDPAVLAKMKEEQEKAAAAQKSSGSMMLILLVALLAIAFGYYKTQM